MSELTNKIIDKKFEYSNAKAGDYSIENELTVTITLHEYRELVKACAISDREIDDANSAKWKKECELDKAKETIQRLKEKILQLTTTDIAGTDDEDELGIKIMEGEEGEA